MNLKDNINESEVTRILEIDFLDHPEPIVLRSGTFRGLIIAYNSCNLPIVENESGIYILYANDGDNEEHNEIIAEDIEVFKKILNLFVEVFYGYDLDKAEEQTERNKVIVSETLRKILLYSPKNKLQFWSDTLGNMLLAWDYLEDILTRNFKDFKFNKMPY